ncbi:NAD-dependent epimerase/dehydratase family protein, partial [Paenibacillus kobensis]|uniref:NAD-dependent epimerase/dehydratase family protein n=1 Tax=Paenibacillus kobensis TaxID=59841 RepID=UPI000FD762F1
MDRMRNGMPNADGRQHAAVVTGAAGFIGAAVCRRLLALGWRVYAVVRPGSANRRLPEQHPSLHLIEGDLMRLPEWTGRLEEAVRRSGPIGAWLHLGWTGVAGAARNDAVQASNVEAVLESVRTAARLGCCCWIGAGSQAEYGRLEGRADEEAAEAPTTGYGRAKLAAGKAALAEAQHLGISGSWVRIFSVYGPDDNSVWLIPAMTRQLLAGESPALTPGGQRWDYLYVDDAADAFAALAERGVNAAAAAVAAELLIELPVELPVDSVSDSAEMPVSLAEPTESDGRTGKTGKQAADTGLYNLGSGESRTIREIAELVRAAAARWMPRRLHRNEAGREADGSGDSEDRLVPP